MTYWGSFELVFAVPGRWGISCAYFSPSDTAFTEAGTASEVAWVEVVERSPRDEEAWKVFRKAKDAMKYFGECVSDSCIDALREIIDSYSDSHYYGYSLYTYAACLRQKEQYEEALKYYRRYLEEFPGSYRAGEATFDIAECLHQLGRYDVALEAFEVACKANPKSWRAASRFRSWYEKREPWPSRRLY